MMPLSHRVRLPGLLFAVGGAVCYGVNMVGARLAAGEGIGGAAIMTYRSALMLVPIAFLIVWQRPSLALPKEGRFAFLTLVATSAGMGLAYLSAVSFVPVTVAAVVFYTYPVLLLVASPVLLGTRIGPPQLLIAACCFAGICLVIGPSFSGLDWRGLSLAGLGSVLTMMQFYTAARCGAASQTTKLFWIHVVALPMGLAAVLATGTWVAPVELMRAPLAIAIAFGGYMLGIVLQLLALSRLNPVVAGFVFCLEPVVTALAAMLALGERLDPHQLAGVALVLAAVMAASLPRWPRRASTKAVPAPDKRPEQGSSMRPPSSHTPAPGEVSP